MPWLFGYGSLIWRPNVKFVQKAPAILRGWTRSFSQMSVDHRGTPASPGRVLTLRRCAGEDCVGRAFRIADDVWLETVRYLDEREKGGYQGVQVEIQVDDETVSALTYIAPPGNPHDVGLEPTSKLISIMATAAGPSGSNREYLLALVSALRAEGIIDPYLESLAALLERRG